MKNIHLHKKIYSLNQNFYWNINKCSSNTDLDSNDFNIDITIPKAFVYFCLELIQSDCNDKNESFCKSILMAMAYYPFKRWEDIEEELNPQLKLF